MSDSPADFPRCTVHKLFLQEARGSDRVFAQFVHTHSHAGRTTRRRTCGCTPAACGIFRSTPRTPPTSRGCAACSKSARGRAPRWRRPVVAASVVSYVHGTIWLARPTVVLMVCMRPWNRCPSFCCVSVRGALLQLEARCNLRRASEHGSTIDARFAS